MRILMVCLGNICRSPIAEGIMKQKVKENRLDWIVESAGTNSYHTGEPPHRFSQKICKTHGIDISDQRASTITRNDLTEYDKIYALADDVYDNIRSLAGNTKVDNLEYFLNDLYKSGKDPKIQLNDSVPDPYYGGEDGYKHVYDLITKACDAIIEKYK